MASKQQQPESWQRPGIELAAKISNKSQGLQQEIASLKSKVVGDNWPHVEFRDSCEAKKRFENLELLWTGLVESAGELQRSSVSVMKACQSVAYQSTEANSKSKSAEAAEAAQKKLAEIRWRNEECGSAVRELQNCLSTATEAFSKASRLCEDEVAFLEEEKASLELDPEDAHPVPEEWRLQNKIDIIVKCASKLQALVRQLNQLKTQATSGIKSVGQLSRFVSDSIASIAIGISHEARLDKTLDAKDVEIERLKALLRQGKK